MGNLVATMHLDVTGTTKQITGSVTNTDNSDPWVAELTADEAVTSFATPQRFTAALPPGGESSSVETADAGYLSLRVTNSAAGSSMILGTAPDGAAISQTVTISKDGYVPFYANINAGAEVVAGWLQVGATLTGSVSRVQDPSASSALNAAGITNANAAVVASIYTNAMPFLSLTNFDLAIEDGVTSGTALVYHLKLTGTNMIKVGTLPTNGFVGSVSALDGGVHVTFRPTSSALNKTMTGVLFQGGNTNHQGYGTWGAPTAPSKAFIIQNAH